MKWFIKCIKQYADFKGRSRRKEYWMFTLFNAIFSIVASLIDTAINIVTSLIGTTIFGDLPPIFATTLYSLFVLIPGLAVCVRRLHDVGKSGWMLLVGLIPIVGGIWLLILMCIDSQPGTNKWGDNPKESKNLITPERNNINFKTNRNIWIFILFSILTLGIYPIFVFSKIQKEIDSISENKIKNISYWKLFVAYLLINIILLRLILLPLGTFSSALASTLPILISIFSIVLFVLNIWWFTQLYDTINYELLKREIKDPATFDIVLWYIGIFVPILNYVFFHGIFKAMNKINESYNSEK